MPPKLDVPVTTQHTPTIALLALGTNFAADSRLLVNTCAAAIKRLQDAEISLLKASEFYLTPCFPAGSGPDYVNAVVQVSTCLSGQELLSTLHQIEAEFKRIRTKRWGQRTLDLDILDISGAIEPNRETFEFWRNLPIERQMVEAPEALVLPHPRIQDRAFVLVPLLDVAPDWQHPVTGLDVASMLDELPDGEKQAVRPIQID